MTCKDKMNIKVRKDANNNARPTVPHVNRKREEKRKPKLKHKGADYELL